MSNSEVTVNGDWLKFGFQLVLITVAMAGGWFSMQAGISKNTSDIVEIKVQLEKAMNGQDKVNDGILTALQGIQKDIGDMRVNGARLTTLVEERFKQRDQEKRRDEGGGQ